LFLDSLLDNLAHSTLGSVEPRTAPIQPQTQPIRQEAQGAEKSVEIELQIETALLTGLELARQEAETIPLHRVPGPEIKQQQGNLDRLNELLDFREVR
jgi:hypothetical protein